MCEGVYVKMKSASPFSVEEQVKIVIYY